MHFNSLRIPYRQTGAFSKIALDYIEQSGQITSFAAHPASEQGILNAIEARKQFPTNRDILADELQKQYSGISTAEKVKTNIELLRKDNTFTVTTAHQNNIFTGPLYFVYKILHAVKLAESLKFSYPQYDFVPVYYMGSEDADQAELNHIFLGGKRHEWKTAQTGAVGRMKVDKELLDLIDSVKGQLGVLPYGDEITDILAEAYSPGRTIQEATFRLVNSLFGEYGLVVLVPDNVELKRQMITVFEDELLNQNSSVIVQQTGEVLEKAGYKIQASPREINLFYLNEDSRERIEKVSGEWRVVNGEKWFQQNELLKELREKPEWFSPNVILRGLYQETILPNIVFIGGGGETAYWLQLKSLFEHYKVPFPLLVLRNSFLIVEQKWQEKILRLGFSIEDFFAPEQELTNRLVKRESENNLDISAAISDVADVYTRIAKETEAVDRSLVQHTEALKVNASKKLKELQKKLLRAEKRKFTEQQQQIKSIKGTLFPADGLQERHDNICWYYAKFGKEVISQLYKYSLSLEQEFVVLAEN